MGKEGQRSYGSTKMKKCNQCQREFELKVANQILCGDPACKRKYANAWQKKLRVRKNEKQLSRSRKAKRELGFPEGVDYLKPFEEVKEGHGFKGVLLCDKKTGEIQCHICGGWFHWLQNHIHGSHKIKGDEYRERFGLEYNTALCSEKVREHLVRRAMTYPWERLMQSKKKLIDYAKSGKSHNKKFRERTKRHAD